jgi:4-diphosphocytidyl-2-C-methyl-D-erythritol kinase
VTLEEVVTTRDVQAFLRLSCPAKVNLSLELLGRRPDGYHELRSVMAPISLADDLELRLAAEPGVRLRVEGADLPAGPDNLVHRAAALVLDEVRAAAAGAAHEPAAPGVEIRLVKRIPVGAGLGGGSSDAAGTLVGLDRLLGSPLGPARLARLALRLGADVPFFVGGRAALATGVGERLEPLPPLPTLWMVLVNPGFPVSTADVYREFDALTGGAGRLTPAPPQVYL